MDRSDRRRPGLIPRLILRRKPRIILLLGVLLSASLINAIVFISNDVAEARRQYSELSLGMTEKEALDVLEIGLDSPFRDASSETLVAGSRRPKEMGISLAPRLFIPAPYVVLKFENGRLRQKTLRDQTAKEVWSFWLWTVKKKLGVTP